MMPMSQLPKELAAIFDKIGHYSDRLKTCVSKHVSNNVHSRSDDDRAAMVLAYRAIKFINAYLLVARNGYYEPSATLTRSIYETYLWSRWVLGGNGQKYLNTKNSQAVKVAKKLHKHGELCPNLQASGMLTDITEPPPSWSDIAKQTDMEQFHDIFYPHFSSVSHGNLYGSVNFQTNQVSYEPDFSSSSMEFAVKTTNGLAALLCDLFEEWWNNGRLAPPPP